LRRSAGIPPTIIAILRAEPDMLKLAHKQNNKKQKSLSQHGDPVLINFTLKTLLELIKNAPSAEAKIHALNIMKYIF
jgi:hypothetical protein